MFPRKNEKGTIIHKANTQSWACGIRKVSKTGDAKLETTEDCAIESEEKIFFACFSLEQKVGTLAEIGGSGDCIALTL
jgi:hypothetical protein